MGYSIFIEEFGHFRRDHIPIVGHRNERDFLAGLRFILGGRRGCLLGLWSWSIAHNRVSITRNAVVKGYSNASNDERSGNWVLQAMQVTK